MVINSVNQNEDSTAKKLPKEDLTIFHKCNDPSKFVATFSSLLQLGLYGVNGAKSGKENKEKIKE